MKKNSKKSESEHRSTSQSAFEGFNGKEELQPVNLLNGQQTNQKCTSETGEKSYEGVDNFTREN